MMETKKTNLKIKHDLLGKLFFAKVLGGNAELHYDRYADEYLDFTSTNVPAPSRGLGIAGQVVEEALQFAKEHQMQVKATCPFVADYIEKHPEHQSLLKEKN